MPCMGVGAPKATLTPSDFSVSPSLLSDHEYGSPPQLSAHGLYLPGTSLPSSVLPCCFTTALGH